MVSIFGNRVFFKSKVCKPFRHKAIAHLTDYRIMKTGLFMYWKPKLNVTCFIAMFIPAGLERPDLSLSSACLRGHDVSSAGLGSPGCAQAHKSRSAGWDTRQERLALRCPWGPALVPSLTLVVLQDPCPRAFAAAASSPHTLPTASTRSTLLSPSISPHLLHQRLFWLLVAQMPSSLMESPHPAPPPTLLP